MQLGSTWAREYSRLVFGREKNGERLTQKTGFGKYFSAEVLSY